MEWFHRNAFPVWPGAACMQGRMKMGASLNNLQAAMSLKTDLDLACPQFAQN